MDYYQLRYYDSAPTWDAIQPNIEYEPGRAEEVCSGCGTVTEYDIHEGAPPLYLICQECSNLLLVCGPCSINTCEDCPVIRYKIDTIKKLKKTDEETLRRGTEELERLQILFRKVVNKNDNRTNT